MNNNYLFHGKRLDNGEWVEGYLWSQRTIGHTSPCGNIDEIVVDPSTVGWYTGKQIVECAVTDDTAYLHQKKVWQDDLIAVYSIGYDDEDSPIRTHVATVQVKWDDQYQMLFAYCIKGSMASIADECDISCLDCNQDYPFTFWLEYMENSSGRFWEYEIISSVHDNPELIGGEDNT